MLGQPFRKYLGQGASLLDLQKELEDISKTRRAELTSICEIGIRHHHVVSVLIVHFLVLGDRVLRIVSECSADSLSRRTYVL